MVNTTAQQDLKPNEYGRPSSIEELSNRYLVHPLSSVVANFAISMRVSANFVSFAGLSAGLLAAVFYYYQPHRLFIALGFLFMVLWHVLDGADGRVARATGSSSPLGRVIDGICDHLVFGAVYLAFVFYLLGVGASNTVWLWAIAAAISHGVQAAGYEERRQKFQRRSRGLSRQGVQKDLLSVNGRPSVLARGYDFMQNLALSKTTMFDAALGGLRVRNAPLADIQNAVNRTATIVRAWALLNANNRTIMLAVTAIAGRPDLYFKYEIIVLNAVFVVLLVYEYFWEVEIATDIVDKPDIRV